MFAEIFYFIKIKESQYTFFWNPESDHSLHRNQPQILPPSPKMYEKINLKQKIFQLSESKDLVYMYLFWDINNKTV